MYTRRRFAASLAVAAGSAPLLRLQASERKAATPRPDPSLFQSGDLVWPKKPDAYVPYHAGSRNSLEEDRQQWMRERDAYVEAASARKLEGVERERVQLLKEMDYREFLAVYEGDQKPGVPGAYSGGSVYVGHVGIIDVDGQGVPHVVEAMLHRGVMRSTYADWLAERKGNLVWLGRVHGLTAEDRAKIVAEAKKHLGTRYDFWNFDLNDSSGFYCSKLVWLSMYRALGFPIDGRANPRRALWLSPKQVLYTEKVDRLHDPGSYGTA